MGAHIVGEGYRRELKLPSGKWGDRVPMDKLLLLLLLLLLKLSPPHSKYNLIVKGAVHK